MKKTLVLLGAMVGAAVATPIDFERIPADAQWYLHADIDRIWETESGEEVKKAVEGDMGKELKDLSQMLFFDPLKDLQSICISGNSESEDNEMIFIEGKFDKAHIIEVLARTDSHETQEYKGVNLHSWKDDGRDQHGAFAEEGLIVFSNSLKGVERAIDLLRGEQKSMAPVKADNSPFIFGFANLEAIEATDEGMDLFKKVSSITAQVNETEDKVEVSMALHTGDPEATKQLRRMVDGLFAMVEMGLSDSEDVAIESSVKPSEDNMGLIVVIKIPYEEILHLLEQLSEIEEEK